MREKLLFVSRRNRLLSKDVALLDSGLGTKRDSLSKLRQRRDSLRQTATKIKETSVYIDNPLLLNDMQACAGSPRYFRLVYLELSYTGDAPRK